MSTFALRGGALTFVGDPFLLPTAEALRHETDALVVIRDGRIADFGAAADLLPALPAGVPVTRYDNALLLPGFVDAHVHFAQLPRSSTAPCIRSPRARSSRRRCAAGCG